MKFVFPKLVLVTAKALSDKLASDPKYYKAALPAGWKLHENSADYWWIFRGKWVMKYGYYLRRNAPKGAIPTYYLTPLTKADASGGYFGWVLQPKASRAPGDISRAMKHFAARDAEHHLKGDLEDLHSGNVGVWRGRPVLIDW